MVVCLCPDPAIAHGRIDGYAKLPVFLLIDAHCCHRNGESLGHQLVNCPMQVVHSYARAMVLSNRSNPVLLKILSGSSLIGGMDGISIAIRARRG